MLDILFVGTGVPDGPKGRFTNRPTDLVVFIKLMPVGEGLAPPVVYKKSLRFARTTGGRPYRFVRRLLFCSRAIAWQAASLLRKHCESPLRV